MNSMPNSRLKAHEDHRREWREFDYAYPVLSRRSKGISLGVNLNPDKICNFDCVYCEVDRNTPGKRSDISISVKTGTAGGFVCLCSSGCAV